MVLILLRNLRNCEYVKFGDANKEFLYSFFFFFFFFKNISWCKHSGMDDYVKKSYGVLVSYERFSWFWFYKIVFHIVLPNFDLILQRPFYGDT